MVLYVGYCHVQNNLGIRSLRGPGHSVATSSTYQDCHRFTPGLQNMRSLFSSNLETRLNVPFRYNKNPEQLRIVSS